jgi:hypothetical protein
MQLNLLCLNIICLWYKPHKQIPLSKNYFARHPALVRLIALFIPLAIHTLWFPAKR